MADQRISIDASAGALDGTEIVPLVRVGSPVTAGSFVTGTAYVILSVGTTNFTLIGATSNTVGVGFVATGPGSGTGTAGATSNLRTTAQTIAGLGSRALFSWALSTKPTIASTGFSTWVNQGSATITDGNSGLVLFAPNSSGVQVRARSKAAPATPYTITALIAHNAKGISQSRSGLGWSDGTKLETMGIYYNGAMAISEDKFSTVSSTPSNNASNNSTGLLHWIQIADNGTNITASFSEDGENFLTLYTVAKASGFLGSSGYSNVVFFADMEASDGYATLLSYAQA